MDCRRWKITQGFQWSMDKWGSTRKRSVCMSVEERAFCRSLHHKRYCWSLFSERVCSIFSDDIVERVCSIPIPKGDVHDQVNWYGHSLHQFSAKEAYRKWVHRDEGDREQSYKWLWSLVASERIRAWIWRVKMNGIRTKAFLSRGNLVSNMRCMRCEIFAEDMHHRLTECHWSKQIWSLLEGKISMNILISN